jgi:hypothetical protein
VSTLSTGQRQKMNFARGLLNDAILSGKTRMGKAWPYRAAMTADDGDALVAAIAANNTAAANALRAKYTFPSFEAVRDFYLNGLGKEIINTRRASTRGEAHGEKAEQMVAEMADKTDATGAPKNTGISVQTEESMKADPGTFDRENAAFDRLGKRLIAMFEQATDSTKEAVKRFLKTGRDVFRFTDSGKNWGDALKLDPETRKIVTTALAVEGQYLEEFAPGPLLRKLAGKVRKIHPDSAARKEAERLTNLNPFLAGYSRVKKDGVWRWVPSPRSRYANQFRFCLMYEYIQSQGAAQLDGLMPFWIENYFSKPNYLKPAERAAEILRFHIERCGNILRILDGRVLDLEQISIELFDPRLRKGVGKYLSHREVMSHLELLAIHGDIAWADGPPFASKSTGTENYKNFFKEFTDRM